MCMCEQWRLHCTSQWGQQTPLSEHVYCVTVAFKMTEQVEQRICIKFCIKFDHFSVETIHPDDSEGHSCGQLVIGSFIMTTSRPYITSPAEFLAKHQITQVTQPPYSPLVPCNFWLFPKLKSSLKGKRFQTFDEIQENTMGQLMEIGRTVWGPKVPTGKGTQASLSCVQCSLYIFQ